MHRKNLQINKITLGKMPIFQNMNLRELTLHIISIQHLSSLGTQWWLRIRVRMLWKRTGTCLSNSTTFPNHEAAKLYLRTTPFLPAAAKCTQPNTLKQLNRHYSGPCMQGVMQGILQDKCRLKCRIAFSRLQGILGIMQDCSRSTGRHSYCLSGVAPAKPDTPSFAMNG